MKKYFLALLVMPAFASITNAQAPPFKSGILEDAFIYDKAPFPECHAVTIAETPKGLVTAFFWRH